MKTTNLQGVYVDPTTAQATKAIADIWAVHVLTNTGKHILVDWFTTQDAAARFTEQLRRAGPHSDIQLLRSAAGLTRHN